MSEAGISVSELVGIINETLGFAYPQVMVEGEVSGFQVRQNKWVHFDLKDEESKVSCFMTVFQLKVPLEDGMKVRVAASPRLTKWGSFSLNVREITLSGEGALRRAFELLKRKLEQEGLFAPERKRALPEVPEAIGLITSADSAACADFMKIVNQRWGGVTIYLASVQVQGAAAPDQIVGAINYFNQLASPVDVLVITRGGGGLEDLAAFNNEAVARAIAASRTPTVVGVGHEIDTTLADYVADRRAATPTDAARIVVPDRLQVAENLDFTSRHLREQYLQKLNNLARLLADAAVRIERFWQLPQLKLADLAANLGRQLRQIEGRLESHQHELSAAGQLLSWQMPAQVNANKREVAAASRLLKNFDTKAVLRQGYAIVRHSSRVVKQATEVSRGDTLMIQLHQGQLEATAGEQTD